MFFPAAYKKKTARGETVLRCANENCRFRKTVVREEEEADE